MVFELETINNPTHYVKLKIKLLVIRYRSQEENDRHR